MNSDGIYVYPPSNVVHMYDIMFHVKHDVDALPTKSNSLAHGDVLALETD